MPSPTGDNKALSEEVGLFRDATTKVGAVLKKLADQPPELWKAGAGFRSLLKMARVGLPKGGAVTGDATQARIQVCYRYCYKIDEHHLICKRVCWDSVEGWTIAVD